MDSLSVRINDGKGNDRHVRARGVRFRKTAPGGHHSASCYVLTDVGAFVDLGPNDRLYVYDGRSGRCVWEGYTDNPGKLRGPGGEGYDITALGGAVRASDASYPYVLVEQRPEPFVRSSFSTKNADTATDERNEDTPSLLLSAKEDKTFATTWVADMIYRGLSQAGHKLARAQASIDAGIVDSDIVLELVSRTSAGASNVIDSQVADTSAGTLSGVVVTDFPNGHDQLSLRVRNVGASKTATEDFWFEFWDVVVRSMLKSVTGADITTGYSTNTVLASQIVTDMIGRGLLPGIDTDATSIAATTYAIDQAAWEDGTSGAEVLEWLALFEPDFMWEYLATTPSGEHRFNFRQWDDANHRYELTTADGFEQPGGDADLCNRIAVAWTDKRGRQRTTIVTQTVEELGSRQHDADAIELPEGLSSAALATRLGQMVLSSLNQPPKAARAVVRRPILDRITGYLVMPWELEPGYSVLVRETGDRLRLTEVEYDHDSRAATLALGTPLRSVEQLVAALSRRGRKALKR